MLLWTLTENKVESLNTWSLYFYRCPLPTHRNWLSLWFLILCGIFLHLTGFLTQYIPDLSHAIRIPDVRLDSLAWTPALNQCYYVRVRLGFSSSFYLKGKHILCLWQDLLLRSIFDLFDFDTFPMAANPFYCNVAFVNFRSQISEKYP